MRVEELLDRFRSFGRRPALLADGVELDYESLERAVHWCADERLRPVLPRRGTVVFMPLDHAPESVMLLLALWREGHIVVPCARERIDASILEEEAQAEAQLTVRGGRIECAARTRRAVPALVERLRADGHPGLVLFSSGTTGRPKGAVHDVTRFLEKFSATGKDLRTLILMTLDHVAGLDTLFYALANGSAAVFPTDRHPRGVCASIERQRVQVLPASPTFLNLMLLTDVHREHDLSTLRYVTYGSEIMPPATLERCAAAFPHVKLVQKYGLTELGALRTQSKANDSVWLRLGGEQHELRVVDSVLQIRSRNAMLGYLNYPSPFTEDGWYITNDLVEQDGDYFRFVGRKSQIVNVAGQKVYPAEVENVVQQLAEVAEVVVYAAAHPLLGQIVCARVRPNVDGLDADALTLRVKRYCTERLDAYKVPMKVTIANEPLFTDRYKKGRIPSALP